MKKKFLRMKILEQFGTPWGEMYYISCFKCGRKLSEYIKEHSVSCPCGSHEKMNRMRYMFLQGEAHGKKAPKLQVLDNGAGGGSG